MRKIYLASSWRNQMQPELVHILRDYGHEVYDFRNPGPGKKGFSWSDIDPNWMQWSAQQYVEAIQTPIAQKGFHNDFDGMEWSDTGVLLLPSGRSAHLELGWLAGSGRDTYILTQNGEEPELMNYLATKVVSSVKELLQVLE